MMVDGSCIAKTGLSALRVLWMKDRRLHKRFAPQASSASSYMLDNFSSATTMVQHLEARQVILCCFAAKLGQNS